MPSYHSQPAVIDIHDYACLLPSGDKFNCDLSMGESEARDATRLEAETLFDGVQAFRQAFCSGGWHGYDPNICYSEVIVGETQSNAASGNQTCEGAPLHSATEEVNGFNASDLGGATTVVFRPWYHAVDSCYPFNHVINPPYDPSQ